MSRVLTVDNYIIEEPLINIVRHVQSILTNGKLRDIQEKKDNILLTCPSHSDGVESKPAGNIYIGDDPNIPYGWFACWVCTFKGPFTKFLAKCFDSTESYAKNWLIKNYGILASNKISIGGPIIFNKAAKRKKLLNINLEELQPYCDYLKQRKISIDTCKLLNIKYDPKKRVIIFPCYDMAGKLVMLPTRSIDTKFFQLDANVEKPLYCIDQIMKNNIKTAIITEGLFDAATAWEFKFPAIATLGSPSDYQINLISKSCITNLYIMFDNDSAGRRFSWELQQKIDPRIILHYVKIPNGYKDINDLDKELFWKIINIAKKS